jgi:hypothetical protein
MGIIKKRNVERKPYRQKIRDYFATPGHVTKALLRREKFTGQIWEPACGQGWMSEVLIEWGYDVVSTDLIKRGYGNGGIDFLKEWRHVPNIITNPPYLDGLHIRFLMHALECATDKVALLLPSYIFLGTTLAKLCDTTPLKSVYVLGRRAYTVPEGKTRLKRCNMPLTWFVWEKGYRGFPSVRSTVFRAATVGRIAPASATTSTLLSDSKVGTENTLTI